MALPKEPRQKMINFMYLVLTAMLALNVSSEILNAFKVVDNSLLSSNITIDNSSSTFIKSLEEQAKKPELAAKVAQWKPKADSALTITNQMSKYIDELKQQLKVESGLAIKDGKEDFKEDDLDASTRLMDTKGKGKELLAKLQQFKTDIANVIPADKRNLLPQIPLDLNPPKSHNEASNKDWTTAYFHMTPTVAALTMLSKFQNDVKRSGNIVVNFCHDQIGKVEVVYDKFAALTSQNSEYLLPGQPFQIQAGLGAFSAAAKPSVTINGQSLPVNDSGYATYRETAGGGGQKTFNVTISFKDPNTGQMQSTTKTVTYTVGQASGASIFLEKMNVMYLGVDNPLSISGGSGKKELMSVSFTGGTIAQAGGDRYIARPSATGPAEVRVTIEGKSYSFPIRCKTLPDPVALVGTLKGGGVSAAQFKAMGGVRAQLQDSEFDAPFSVLGYTVGGTINGQYQEQVVNGSQWGGNAVIANAKPGSLVWINNIRAQGPDGKQRKINDLTFKLQ